MNRKDHRRHKSHTKHNDKSRNRDKTRHRKDSFSRMPVNDIERINRSKRLESNFKAKILSKSPYIVKMKNLLSHREIDELLKIANKKGFERSNMVVDNELVISNYRTSQTSYLLSDGMPRKYNKYIENIIRKICYLVDCKRSQIEGLMAVKYDGEEEYFNTHVDFFSSDDEMLINDGGNRLSTFFIYANTLERGDGGETEFPELGIKSRPVKGDAVFWHNFVRGKAQRDTLHRGNPPAKGKVKIGINCWVRDIGW